MPAKKSTATREKADHVIKIAAGDFCKEQWLQDCQYAKLPDLRTAFRASCISPASGRGDYAY